MSPGGQGGRVRCHQWAELTQSTSTREHWRYRNAVPGTIPLLFQRKVSQRQDQSSSFTLDQPSALPRPLGSLAGASVPHRPSAALPPAAVRAPPALEGASPRSRPPVDPAAKQLSSRAPAAPDVSPARGRAGGGGRRRPRRAAASGRLPAAGERCRGAARSARQHVRQGASEGQSDQGQRHPPALLLLRRGEWPPGALGTIRGSARGWLRVRGWRRGEGTAGRSAGQHRSPRAGGAWLSTVPATRGAASSRSALPFPQSAAKTTTKMRVRGWRFLEGIISQSCPDAKRLLKQTVPRTQGPLERKTYFEKSF